MNRPHRLVTALLLVATATAGTAHADDASRKEALSKASSAGHLVLSMAKAVAAHESADVDHLKKWVGFCNEAADRLVADGAGPDTLITVDETQVALGAYKTEVCAKGAAAHDAWMNEIMGPYQKVLKNDKYDELFRVYPDGFYLPGGGGESTKDPAKLAKANVWFEILEGDTICARGPVYTYIRYQFDKNQKIAKQSSKEYCGDPGPKVLK